MRVIRALLENGTREDNLLYVNLRDNNAYSALMHAASNGQSVAARVLLENGALTLLKDNFGRTALMIAVFEGYIGTVRVLLQFDPMVDTIIDYDGEIKIAGSTINLKGYTPLMVSTLTGQTGIVNALLDKGATANLTNNRGSTALMIAVWRGHLDIAEALLDKGADIDARDSNGGTALMWAARDANVQFVNLLLDKGADANARDNDGETALMSAANVLSMIIHKETLRDRLEILKTFLEHGADVNAKNNRGETALEHAALWGHRDIMDFLKQAGAKE